MRTELLFLIIAELTEIYHIFGNTFDEKTGKTISILPADGLENLCKLRKYTRYLDSSLVIIFGQIYLFGRTIRTHYQSFSAAFEKFQTTILVLYFGIIL